MRTTTGSSLWIGLTLLVLGTGWLLDSFDVLHFGRVLRMYWPVLLMIIAIVQYATRSAGLTGSAILFSLGALLQLDKFELLPGGFWSAFWPVMLIAIGLSLIAPYVRGKSRMIGDLGDNPESNTSFIQQTTLFSGAELRSTSSTLMGGELTAVFGGIELDLRDCHMAARSAMFKATAIFGGIEIIVPPTWRVVVTGTPIFGGVDNVTQHRTIDPQAPTLLLDVTAVFGGIEIR